MPRAGGYVEEAMCYSMQQTWQWRDSEEEEIFNLIQKPQIQVNSTALEMIQKTKRGGRDL